MNRQLLHRLGGIFDTHQILASDLYREIYSRDGSYFDIKPEVIVRPDTPQQVQQLLAIASEAGNDRYVQLVQQPVFRHHHSDSGTDHAFVQ